MITNKAAIFTLLIGIKTSINNFYKNQNHVKAVDNFRRTTGATKEQLMRMFNQLNNY